MKRNFSMKLQNRGHPDAVLILLVMKFMKNDGVHHNLGHIVFVPSCTLLAFLNGDLHTCVQAR